MGCSRHTFCSSGDQLFEEFFEMGQELSASPFLTSDSRRWGHNLSLKSSILAGFFLLVAFVFSFFSEWTALSNLFLTFVFFLVGAPSLIGSLEDLAELDVNIDVLMTLAAFGSILLGSGLEGALLLVLFEISGSLEETVSHKARGAISSLRKLSPTKAKVVDSAGKLHERSVKDVSIGEKILVRSGEVVPLDGTVVEGISSVNLVHLTGENLPVKKAVGDEVAAGARNLEGAITLEVIRTNVDSTLARIIQLVTQAQEAQPKLQRWFDRLSRRYAISIILFSFFLAAVLPFLINIPWVGIGGSVYRSLAFLIAASPCALIIAIPVAYLSAVSACARKGILLKGGVTLDALAGCSVLAFDKTGTLTTGELGLTAMESLQSETDLDETDPLAVAIALERGALHPIAKAVVAVGEERGIAPVKIRDFKAIAGYGLEGVAELTGRELPVYIGSPDYILSKVPPSLSSKLAKKVKIGRERGELLAVLLIGEEIFLFHFQDTLRKEMKGMIERIRALGSWRICMLTGDHEISAKKIASEVGIDEYYASLKPEDKLKFVSDVSVEKGLVMVGDGINDAPALARATVGVSMGQVGSTTAVDAADVVLLQDDLTNLDWLMLRSKKTQRVVKQNLILAVGAILVATSGALVGVIPLWLAVLMHEGGTVLVGLNALRLIRL